MTEQRKEDVTVLMTGAGAPGASGILRSLRMTDERRIRIVGVDMDPNAYGFALVDSSHTVPPGGSEEYIDTMASIAASEGADVILPLTTNELEPLARHHDSFDATVMVSPPASLSLANDKARLYAFLEAESFDSAPAFERVDSRSAFVEAVNDLGYPSEPVCFKPPVASGMRGFRVLEEEGEPLRRLLEEKPTAAVTRLEEVLPILSSADSFPELIVMEYLPGAEYSVDVVSHTDGVRPVIPRSRSQTRAGITFEGTVERRPDLIRESRAICERLGVEYNVNLQFRYDGDGNPRLIEINPRVSGTIIMCVGAGANLPYLGVKQALGESVPPVDVDWGTTMKRYWQEVFRSPAGETFHLEGPPDERNPLEPEGEV